MLFWIRFLVPVQRGCGKTAEPAFIGIEQDAAYVKIAKEIVYGNPNCF